MLTTESLHQPTDKMLILKIKKGDKKALDQLIEQHYQYVYNVALKFFNVVTDAEDATQEVIIKVITNIGTYAPEKAQFRTWLYRIVFNHFVNAKKTRPENLLVNGFETFFGIINDIEDQSEEGYLEDTIEEVKVSCMAGMLMCLDREQRMIYILGELFRIDHNLAGEIFEISPANFRKRLSRVRKDLYQWMNNKCGLVNTKNPCRCPKKTKGFIEKGFVNADAPKWNSNFKKRIYELSEKEVDPLLIESDKIYTRLYREHPFKETKQKSDQILATIFENKTFAETLNIQPE